MRVLLFLLFLPIVVIAQDGGDAFAKGESLFKKASYKKAQPLFESYLEEHPNDLKALEYLGDIAGYTKNWDVAIEYYEKLVKHGV